jgi:hypothetical protein
MCQFLPLPAIAARMPLPTTARRTRKRWTVAGLGGSSFQQLTHCTMDTDTGALLPAQHRDVAVVHFWRRWGREFGFTQRWKLRSKKRASPRSILGYRCDQPLPPAGTHFHPKRRRPRSLSAFFLSSVCRLTSADRLQSLSLRRPDQRRFLLSGHGRNSHHHSIHARSVDRSFPG